MSGSFWLRNLLKRLLPRSLHPVRFQLARLARNSRRRQELIGPFGKAIFSEGFNGRLLVPAGDTQIASALLNDGSYNQTEIEFHLRNLTSASKVLFVGAHIGALLVPIAKHVGPVIGIEANPETFALLEMNVRLNSLDNVTLHQLAAGDRECEMKIIMHSQNTGASKLKQGKIQENDPVFGYDRPRVAPVQMARLDDVLTDRDFDLIVMDVEGAEILALRGMPEILERSRRLQVEVVPYLIEEAEADPSDIVGMLGPAFERAWKLEDAMRGAPSMTIDQMVAGISRMTRLVDLYFEKLDQSKLH